MLKAFTLIREQVHFDFDMSKINSWIKTVDKATLVAAVPHGVFNLTAIYSYEPKAEAPKEDKL